jgi:hypothetical protein
MGRLRSGAVAVLILLLSSVVPTTAQQPHAPKAWTDPIREATVAIGVQTARTDTEASGKSSTRVFFKPIGSGAIFVETEGIGDAWLVTAKHVFTENPALSHIPASVCLVR